MLVSVAIITFNQVTNSINAVFGSCMLHITVFSPLSQPPPVLILSVVKPSLQVLQSPHLGDFDLQKCLFWTPCRSRVTSCPAASFSRQECHTVAFQHRTGLLVCLKLNSHRQKIKNLDQRFVTEIQCNVQSKLIHWIMTRVSHGLH